MSDEQAIRDLVQTWIKASTSGDLDQVFALMSEDVVFLTPGQPPFGKETFAAASRAAQGKVRVEGNADVKEVQVSGDVGYCRVHLTVVIRSTDGADLRRLSGYTMSVLRKQDGRWVIVRDANFVVPERRVHAAVPVFQVASVARSIAWYRDTLGFAADPFGPPDDPVFAILSRDGVEIMLQKGRPAAPPAAGWSAYVRVADVHAVYAAVLSQAPDTPAIMAREYGCQEFNLRDPDGHTLVISQRG